MNAALYELRTQITIARGHAELIRNAHPQEQTAEDALVIVEELGRLSRSADRLLLLAASRHPDFVHPTRISLEQVVEDAARRWRSRAPRRWKAEVRSRGTFVADAERLEVGLDALIENAVTFTREGESISIIGRAENETALIEVVDAGAGIPKNRRSAIFRRFFSADSPRSTGRELGLGLAVVQAIAKAHGGNVSVESEVGRGSTFRISLPGFSPAKRA